MNKPVLYILLVLMLCGVGLTAVNIGISDINLLEMDISNEVYSSACNSIAATQSCNNSEVAKRFLDSICNTSCISDNCRTFDADLNKFAVYNYDMCKQYKNTASVLSGNALRVSLLINVGVLVVLSIGVVMVISFIVYELMTAIVPPEMSDHEYMAL